MAAAPGQGGAGALLPMPPFSTEMTEEEVERRDKILNERSRSMRQHYGALPGPIVTAMCYAANDGVILRGHTQELRFAYNRLLSAYQALSVAHAALAARVAAGVPAPRGAAAES